MAAKNKSIPLLHFDLKKALNGAPVRTRKGWPVSNLILNPEEGEDIYTIRAVVYYLDGNACPETFTEDGSFSVGKESDCDLFMVDHIGDQISGRINRKGQNRKVTDNFIENDIIQ